jgi:hypothetical protein
MTQLFNSIQLTLVMMNQCLQFSNQYQNSNKILPREVTLHACLRVGSIKAAQPRSFDKKSIAHEKGVLTEAVQLYIVCCTEKALLQPE